MANSVAALDFQKASGIVHRMQECIKNIHKFAGTFVGARRDRPGEVHQAEVDERYR